MKTKYLLLILLMSFLSGFSQELALARQDGKFGYITKDGEWRIQPTFKVAKNFSGELAEAMNDKKKWGFINRKGEWKIEPSFDKTKAFNSGVAMVLDSKQWIYINEKGEKILSNITSDKLYDFKDGFALYREGDFVGFINTDGKIVIAPKFQKAFNFENGYAKVRENDKWGLIDESGNYFVKTEYDGISNFLNGQVVGNKGDVYGLIVDGEFKEVSGAQKIWDFSVNGENTYAKMNDKIGFIDNKGNWIIEPTYDKVRAFKNGLAPVMKDKKWGYINVSGELKIPFEYRDAEVFSSDGLAPVKIDKLWGFINAEGKLIIEDKYVITAGGFSIFQKNNQKGFYEGLARVKKEKTWVYLNTKGEILNNLTFENLELFK